VAPKKQKPAAAAAAAATAVAEVAAELEDAVVVPSDVMAPDFDDAEASPSSAQSHKLARKSRKALRAKENLEIYARPDELIAKDCKLAKESLEKQRDVFTGPARGPNHKHDKDTIEPDIQSVAKVISEDRVLRNVAFGGKTKLGSEAALAVRMQRASITESYRKNPDLRNIQVTLCKQIYAQIAAAKLKLPNGQVATNENEAKAIIARRGFEVQLFTTEHIRLLSRQCGVWTLVESAGSIKYPGCSNVSCAFLRARIRGFEKRPTVPPIILLNPDEIGDARKVEIAGTQQRSCFWCACVWFGMFLSSYADVHHHVPLPQTEVQQVFRVKRDAQGGFYQQYLYDYTNGKYGGGICDGVPRFKTNLMHVTFDETQRYIINFDAMCYVPRPRVPGTGGRADLNNANIEREARRVQDKKPTFAEQMAMLELCDEGPVTKTLRRNEGDDASTASPANLPLRATAPDAAPAAAAAAAVTAPLSFAEQLAQLNPFHNANSRAVDGVDINSKVSVENEEEEKDPNLRDILDRYRSILAPSLRGVKQRGRGGSAAAAAGAGAGAKAKRTPAGAGIERLSSDPMISSMNHELLRARSECRRRVAGLFASLKALAVYFQEFVKTAMSEEVLILRISSSQRFARDIPKFSALATPYYVDQECATQSFTFMSRPALLDELGRACLQVDAGRLAAYAEDQKQSSFQTRFFKTLRGVVDALNARVKVNVYRFAILHSWYSFVQRTAEELRTQKRKLELDKKRNARGQRKAEIAQLKSKLDALGHFEYHLMVNMDVYWHVCYSLLRRVYDVMVKEDGLDPIVICTAFRIHSDREDIIDPLYDSYDVIDEMTLPEVTRCIERSFLDTSPRNKRVPIIQIFEKCLPRRSMWRMGEDVTLKYMKKDLRLCVYILQVIMCALLGNYSDLPVGARIKWRTRCFLYHSYHASVTTSTDFPGVFALNHVEPVFESLIGLVKRFCFHSLHRHIHFVARTDPHIERCLKSLYKFELLMNGADDVLNPVRTKIDEALPVIVRTLAKYSRPSTAEDWKQRSTQFSKVLAEISKEAEKQSKTVMEVVPLAKKLTGFVNKFQSFVSQIPILTFAQRRELRKLRCQHRSVAVGPEKDGVRIHRFDPDAKESERDEHEEHESEEDGEDDVDGRLEDALTEMAVAATSLGEQIDGMDEPGVLAAVRPPTRAILEDSDLDDEDDDNESDKKKKDAQHQEQPSGAFRSISDFGLSRKVVLAIEEWVRVICDPSIKFSDYYLFELLEMAGYSKTGKAWQWLQYMCRQFQLETKILEKVREFSIRFPLAYAILQTFAVFYRRRALFQVIELPLHYKTSQFHAGRARFHCDVLMPERPALLPEEACTIEYCTVCLRVNNVVREPIHPGHVFNVDAGYINTTMDVDFGDHSKIIFRCNGREVFAGRSCSTEPLAKLQLLGKALLYRGDLVMFCPQPGCGVPSVMCNTRSVFTKHGPACSDCSLSLAAASLVRKAHGKSPYVDTECFAARYLADIERLERARQALKKKPAKASGAAASAAAAAATALLSETSLTAATAGTGVRFSALELKSVCETLSREKVTDTKRSEMLGRASLGGALQCHMCDAVNANVHEQILLDFRINLCDKHNMSPMRSELLKRKNHFAKRPTPRCQPADKCDCDGSIDYVTCDGKLNLKTLITIIRFYHQPENLKYAREHSNVFGNKRVPGRARSSKSSNSKSDD
jgi:hypothetical protein